MASSQPSNHEVVAQFYSYRPLLLNKIRTRISDSDDVEDLVQEVYLRLLDYPAPLRPEMIKGLAFSIVNNVVCDYLRRHYVRTSAHTEIFNSLEEETDQTEQEIIGRDLESFKNKRIAAMPPKRRLIYIMRINGNLPNQDIAQRLNLSCRTVENHFFKAQTEMRRWFQEVV